MAPAALGTTVWLLAPAPVVVEVEVALELELELSVVWPEVPLVAPPAGAMLSGAAFAPVA